MSTSTVVTNTQRNKRFTSNILNEGVENILEQLDKFFFFPILEFVGIHAGEAIMKALVTAVPRPLLYCMI